MIQEDRKHTTILIVDDEIDFRNALAFSFGRKGFNVLTAENGHEALKIIQSQSIDVVISDIRMPNGDGIELLEKVKKIHPETPIILLVTGYTELTSEEAYHKGAEALFTKPLDLKRLEETIDRLLTPRPERWNIPSNDIEAEIRVEVRFKSIMKAIESKVVNIGRGGMFIALTSDIAFPNVHEEISFKLIFSSTNIFFSGNGIVRWIRTQQSGDLKLGFGVEFTFLEEQHRKQILDYISKNKLKSFIPKQ